MPYFVAKATSSSTGFDKNPKKQDYLHSKKQKKPCYLKYFAIRLRKNSVREEGEKIAIVIVVVAIVHVVLNCIFTALIAAARIIIIVIMMIDHFYSIATPHCCFDCAQKVFRV